jgi:hypothetical protein
MYDNCDSKYVQNNDQQIKCHLATNIEMKTSGIIHSSSIAQASKNHGSHIRGLSLNECLAGKRIEGSFPDGLKASTPSFDLIDINNHDGANASSIML